MSNLIPLSSLFTGDAIASHFDNQAAINAGMGKTYAPLLTMLDGAYGLQIPAATAAAIKYLNANLFKLEKAPALAKGIGARAAVITVTNALHQYATAILAGMHADTLLKHGPDFAVAALPAWADNVKIAAAKQARKDAKAAKAPESESESEGEEDTSLAAAINAAPRDLPAESRAAWAAFSAFLSHNALTVAERDAYIAQLQACVTIPEPVTKAEAKAAKVAKKASSAKRNEAGKVASAKNVAAIKADLSARAAATVANADTSAAPVVSAAKPAEAVTA